MKVFTKDIKLARIISLIFALVIFFCYPLSGCNKENINKPDPITFIEGFSVNFIDVGNGDCIFITFPDGKNMMIDCGQRSKGNFSAIKEVVNTYSNGVINSLVLTHPDVDHVGNAVDVINEFSIERCYLPNVALLDDYYTFKQTVDTLNNKNIKYDYSNEYISFVGEDYFVAFLSPLSTSSGGYYGEFNASKEPSDVEVNNLSPIIYVEYKGVRFLFTGDAGKSQEKLLLKSVESNFPAHVHGSSINLYDIDVLKVAHHGAEDCTSEGFLEVVNPTHAVISVGSNNVFGHPSSLTLNRLYNRNPSVEILRTDVLGTITFGVDSQGKITIHKQSE